MTEEFCILILMVATSSDMCNKVAENCLYTLPSQVPGNLNKLWIVPRFYLLSKSLAEEGIIVKGGWEACTRLSWVMNLRVCPN